jgi:CelD/BcsL family acetyltransferase involved in cellulose biosynthesis
LNHYLSPELDFGEPEVILPQAPDAARRPLWLRSCMLSEINHRAIINSHTVQKAKNFVAQVKEPTEHSGKTRSTQRRKLRMWRDAGGVVRQVSDFSATELSDIYVDLYRKRRHQLLPCRDSLVALYTELKDMVFGHVMFMADQPCAYQLVLRAESPCWISYEYINGATDPDLNNWSIGSILLWLNTHSAWEECSSTGGRQMRYSFGRNRGAYKQGWCRAQPVFRTITF